MVPSYGRIDSSRPDAVGVHGFLAFDLGAESGRAIFGSLGEERLETREVHRFRNPTATVGGRQRWDIHPLLEEIKRGMKFCVTGAGTYPESIAVDTWGVDFALLDGNGGLLELPRAYRDTRIDAMEQFFEKVPRERVYMLTGIQTMPFNTLYQLFALKVDEPSLLEAASDLLFMPDLFDYLLTGVKKSEFTFATTSQLYNPLKGDWDDELFEALRVSKRLMQAVVAPGTVIGNLTRDVASETELGIIPVVATASHDTAAAVAAVPAGGEDWAFISSGTWSLVGIETTVPIMTGEAMRLNFTNEGGAGGTFRFLRNVMGLWLLQGCRKAWESKGPRTYDEIIEMAASAQPFAAIIDPDCVDFLNPPDMPEAIRAFCVRTGQEAPDSPGGIARCVLEGLALRYREVLEQLRSASARPINRIHVVGGGSLNRLLCQFTADATGLPVVAGPIEATAVGNIMVQAMALGYVSSLDEIRDVVRRSFEVETYEPGKTGRWDEAYACFKNGVRS